MIVNYLINYPLLADLLYVVVIPLIIIGVAYLWHRHVKRRHRSSRVLPVAVLLAVLIMGGYLYGKYVCSRQFEVNRIELRFADLPEAFDGYRIVQLSDLHAGTIDSTFLRHVVDSVNALHPDLIVFTGDMQNADPSELKPLVPILKRLKAANGICSILGNHDYSHYSLLDDEREKINNLGRTMGYQQDMDWYLLANDRHFIRRDGQRIVIAGMENDGEGRFPQLGDIQASLYGANRSDFVVMLEHDPTAWRRKILRRCHAQLTLSGHTHGGQIAFFGWSPASLLYREHRGVYWMHDRCMFVTKGIGGAIPVRIGVTPEIAVITLKKK